MKTKSLNETTSIEYGTSQGISTLRLSHTTFIFATIARSLAASLSFFCAPSRFPAFPHSFASLARSNPFFLFRAPAVAMRFPSFSQCYSSSLSPDFRDYSPLNPLNHIRFHLNSQPANAKKSNSKRLVNVCAGD